MKTLQDTRIEDILPANLLLDSKVKSICEAVNPELRLVTESAREALIMPRIDELDERIIDLLAWEYHVDFYELADSLEVKRKLVKDSLKWHMKKGTKWAVLKALDMLGIEAKYHNWYEFGGEPFTFMIDATVKPEYYEHSNHEKLIENIYRAVNDSKAARSMMVKLNTNINESDSFKIYYGIARGLSGYHHVYIDAPEDQELRIINGIAQGLTGRKIFWPAEPELNYETRVYQGVVMTLINSFSILVDYIQPECEYRDKIYIADANNLSGSSRISADYGKLESSIINLSPVLIETDSYFVRVCAKSYPYERMCRDVWKLTGEPDYEIENNFRIQPVNILSGHVVIGCEND